MVGPWTTGHPSCQSPRHRCMKDLVGGILTAPEASGSGHLSLGDEVEKKHEWVWLSVVSTSSHYLFSANSRLCCNFHKPWHVWYLQKYKDVIENQQHDAVLIFIKKSRPANECPLRRNHVNKHVKLSLASRAHLSYLHWILDIVVHHHETSHYSPTNVVYPILNSSPNSLSMGGNSHP